jgi:hypothetical protein
VRLKCDKELAWWLNLANLYKTELISLSVPESGHKGFAAKVSQLKGPRPEGVEILLNPRGPLADRLIGLGNDPDTCLWGLAGVANSLFSGLSDVPEGISKEIVVADWSDFRAPLILAVSNRGEIAQAYRPEPLASGLLSLLKGKKASALGTCPVCGKLFERLRRDQQCDNRRCRDSYRQRRFRETRRHGHLLGRPAH